MDVIIELANKLFKPHLGHGWTNHHADHFDSIGSTFWSEILQSA